MVIFKINIKERVKKLFRKISISLAYGLKNTEDDILKQKASSLSNSITNEQKVSVNELADALLKGVVTEEVELLRDRTYFVLEESKKYQVSYANEQTGEIKVKKINMVNSFNKPNTFIEDGFNDVIIMETPIIVNNVFEMMEAIEKNYEQYRSCLIFQYEYLPKFKLDKYIKRIVVKESIYVNNGEYRLNLYIPKFTNSPEQTEKIFDNEINKIKKSPNLKKSLEFETVSFTTENAFGAEDLNEFSFKMVDFIGIGDYKNYHVLIYVVEPIIFKNKITDKYIKPELRKKYKNKDKKNIKLTADFSELKV